MTYLVEQRVIPAQATAVRRDVLPPDRLGAWLAETYTQVADHLRRAGRVPAGAPFCRYAFRDGSVEVEAGFPVALPLLDTAEVVASSLPGGQVAVTTHHGRYEDLTAAYQAVLGWLTMHALDPAGRHWEVYYTNPADEPDPARWRTDVFVPCRSRTAATVDAVPTPVGRPAP